MVGIALHHDGRGRFIHLPVIHSEALLPAYTLHLPREVGVLFNGADDPFDQVHLGIYPLANPTRLSLMGHEGRNGEISQQERAEDHAGGDRDERIAHRKAIGSRERRRNGEHERKRDASLRTGQSHGKSASQILSREQMAHSHAREPLMNSIHSYDPKEADCLQHDGQQRYDSQDAKRIPQASLGHRTQDARELHPQDDEDDPIQHEAHDIPHTAGLQFLLRRLCAVAVREQRHGQPGCDHCDDSADMQLLRYQIDNKGQQQL